MAARVQLSGAQVDWAPFPDDRFYKINMWELENNTVVTVYRKGEELIYRLTDDYIDTTGDLVSPDGADDFIRFIEKSMPVRVANIVRFVAKEDIHDQYPSRINPKKMITQEVWAVTMISQMTPCEKAKKSGCLTAASHVTGGIGGHAYIQIEGINEFKQLFYLVSEITNVEEKDRDRVRIPHNRAIPLLKYKFRFREDWPRSNTYLRSAQRVRDMILDIQKQIENTNRAVEDGHPHLIRFNGFSPHPEENEHNCCSWIFQETAIAGIRIPMVEPPLPGKGWYIPEYHLNFLDVLCRRKVEKREMEVEKYATDKDLAAVKKIESGIEDEKRDLKGLGITYVPLLIVCAVVPVVGWVLLPYAAIAPPIQMAICGFNINRKEKALKKKKIELLQLHYEG